jgi:hypothetical protein
MGWFRGNLIFMVKKCQVTVATTTAPYDLAQRSVEKIREDLLKTEKFRELLSLFN